MSPFSINREQTNLLKGVGILLIIFHNYFHWVPPYTGENEFIFNPEFVQNLFNGLKTSPLDIPNTLFSYFGHFGVQLFLFISGYGLAKSFQKKEHGFIDFMKKRAAKIYPAFIIGIIVLIAYVTLVYGFPDLKWFAKIGLKLAMVHTLIPGQALAINGPWWFYGLIMQLYVLFIPLFFVIRKWGWQGFAVVAIASYLLIFSLYQPLLSSDLFVMANAPGHIPEFTLGILLAFNTKVSKWAIPLCVVIFIIGNFYFLSFPLTFITITYLLVVLILKLFRRENILFKVIVFYGKLSMFLFAIHGFFRRPYFVETAIEAKNPLITALLAFIYLLVVTIVAYVSKVLYERLFQKQKTSKLAP